MTVHALTPWRRPGCGEGCFRTWHDPDQHENYGRSQERRRALGGLTVRTGPLTVDLDARTVAVADEQIHLTDTEWRLLAYLAEQIGSFCPLADVIRAVWGEAYLTNGVDFDARHLIRVNVARLRAKLGTSARLLVTQRTYGNSPTNGLRLDREPPV